MKFKFIKYIILLILLVFYNSSYSNNNQNKQTLQKNNSSFNNDLFSGIASYNYNFNFPSGVNNLTPSLGLNYNSAKVDYLNQVGYGFDLSMNSIFRSTKKGNDQLYVLDEYAINSDFSNNELQKDSNGNYIGVLNNDINKYSLIDDTFIVNTPNGKTYYFGSNENSKQISPENNKTFRWMLSKVVDQFGNEVSYTYIKSDNNIYLSEISYGIYNIKIEYYDKLFSTQSYTHGFKIENHKLVKNIIVNYNDSEIKKYALQYINMESIFPKLVNIKELSGSQVYENISFDYYAFGIGINLLKEINNGKGLITNLEYKAASLYKNTTVPFLLKTLHKVSYHEITTGLKYSNTYDYYGGNFYFDSTNIYNRGYTGFAKVKVIDEDGSYKYIYFHQSDSDKNNLTDSLKGEFEDHISKKGKIYREETYDKNNNLLKSDITKWVSELQGDNKWKVLKERETKNLINGNNITSSAVEYVYDTYANILEQVNYGEVNILNEKGDFEDIKTDKKVTKFTYSKNVSKHLYGFIKSQELYDMNNNLSSKKELLYDNQASGNVDFGNITNIKTYTNSTNFVEEKNQYNQKGLLIKSINPRGYATTYTYDSYGIYPISKTNAKGFIESYVYNYKVGKPSKVTSINNLETSYSYDNSGRLLSESVKLGNTDYTTKQIKYDDINIPNSIQTTINFDKNNQNTQNIYAYKDGFEKEIQVKKSFKNKFITNKFLYDENENTLFTSYPTYENNSNYTVLNKQTEFGNSYIYDDLNRVIKITNKSGDIVYNYNNLDFSITNQKGIKTQYNYDVLGNLVGVTEPGNILTKYNYNTLNQLTKIVDAENNQRSITYNLAGQRLSIEDLHTADDVNFGTRYYSYDNNGNINTFTTLAGEVISYNYDELDRITSETFTGSTTSFQYDSGGNAKGMLSSYNKGNYSESYNYNEQGLLIGETKSYGADNYTYLYEYDLLGQRIQTTYPDDSIVTNSYENSVPTLVKYNNTDLVTNINHNPTGAIDDITYANGAITKNIYDYEHGYRLLKKGILFGDSQYGLTNYTFDSVGNIINLKEEGTIPEFQKDVSYSYDNLNRLTQANYSPSEIIDYSFNDIGNIMSNSRVGNYSYGDNGRNNPHAVTALTPTLSLEGEGVAQRLFEYDNNGNIINDSKSSFIYNSKDELTQSTNSGTVTNYTYNSQGIRVEKQTGSSVNRYVNKDYEVEQVGTGSIINKYIFLGDTKIASVKTENNSESIIYHHSDHLGGGNIDLDSNGAILQVVDYYPFGAIRNQYNSSEYENKYKFGGKERDTESGLDYFEARYYDNGIGRFNSIDRVFWEVGGFDIKNKNERGDLILSNPQQLNAYSYVVNNPLLYVDPDGEFAIIFVFLGGGSSATAATAGTVALYTATAASVSAAAYQIHEFLSDDSGTRVESNSSNSVTGSPSPGKPPKKDDKTSQNTVDTNAGKLNISQHATERMAQRNISKSMIQNTVNKGESFNYIHNGKQLQGFYNKDTQIFIGKHGNKITTVINKVKQNYINNLKSQGK